MSRSSSRGFHSARRSNLRRTHAIATKSNRAARDNLAKWQSSLQPKRRGEGYEFIDAIVGGVVSNKHIPAVDKGIHDFLTHGPYAGYPVVDVAVTLYDGKEHPVDSNENAFKTAGKMAFKEAFFSAKPVLLEPIYDIEIAVPGDHMGDVLGDISSRRGKIVGMDSRNGFEVIRAQVPLAELYHYSTRLRSLTQGLASHKQSFSHYEEAPREFADKVVQESRSIKWRKWNKSIMYREDLQ